MKPGFATHMAGPIQYLERPGNGPVFVLLHGIGSNASSFAPLLEIVPEDWRLIAWNSPGYGASAPLQAEWPEAADYAASLLRFLDDLGLEAPYLVGHSLGTLIGAAFAATHPDRMTRLLLASPALGHGIAKGQALSAAAQSRLDDLARLGPQAFAAERAARLIYDAERHPQAVARVQAGMAQVRMPGYGQAVRMLASGRLLKDVARLRVSCDVIVGAEDIITPPIAAIQTHNAIAPELRGTFTQLPATGHAIYQQIPAGFAAALHRLAGLRSEISA